jgi:hypothetical protein
VTHGQQTLKCSNWESGQQKKLSHMGKGAGKNKGKKPAIASQGPAPPRSSFTMPVRKHKFFHLGCEYE